ncbi:MAG: primosomal protein N' [Bacilli bacterium]
MLLVKLLIERTARSLDRPFSYLYDGKDTIVAGVRVLVEFNHKTVVGYVVSVEKTNKTGEELSKETGFTYKFIEKVLDHTPLLSKQLMALATRMSSYYLAPHIAILQTMLPLSLRPRMVSLHGPKVAYDVFLFASNQNEEGLTPKQKELLRYIINNPEVNKRDLKSPSIIKKLIELGRIQEIRKEKRRYKLPSYPVNDKPELTRAQKEVVDEFINSKDQIYLLEGVTGSGKTEVYLALAEYYLAQNKTVLMLVPEIALTPMMVAMFLARYDKQVAVLHSELTPAEKYDEYRRIAQKKCKIVVGTRSAIFAPLTNLGLIILDEEHSDSYKQDQMPTYHARTVAIFRSEIEGAKVLLGSATPALESKARAAKNVYHQLNLAERINKKELPKTAIINMLDYRNIDSKSLVFSKQLLNSLRETLNRNEQAILLINRRGYATYITCRSCGHVFRCPNDQTTLTYHMSDNMLKCHHCDHVEEMSTICPACGSTQIRKTGYGTELVDREVKKFFPSARTLRLDSDSAKERSRIAKTVEAFRKQEADILIGTQMIAKGHDFPLVTLVGIVNADLGLLVPSYKSSERTFQLITQAVGRSGRANRCGEAIIQTNLPQHYAITLGAKQDYHEFFNQELIVRSLSQNPPFTYLIKLTLKSKSESTVERVTTQLAIELATKLNDNASIIGPSLPFIFYERNTYARYILIKYRDYEIVKATLEKTLMPLIAKSDFQVIIDVDAEDV